ncbi:MAG: helix-hairpin-helix domain-containing protein [Bacteroidaceae bacterium]|nr:helix-hairpin-helix domain-containing protein [Bacteroidaceae bacterium]
MKRLPTFTQSQRRALLVIEWVLLIGIIAFSIWKAIPSDSPVKEENEEQKSSPLRGSWVGEVPKEQPFETFPFDPNTADSTTLLRLGLSPWQVRSIYRYRAKHGRYHKPDDFKRLPGLTNEQWDRLMPQIRISTEFQYVESKQSYQESVDEMEEIEEKLGMSYAALRDTSYHQEKIRPGQTIDINTADTSQLKKIPGIASKRAARIVNYRRSLGGFVNVEQAMEAIELPDSVMKYMTVSQVPVTKINVNKLSVQQLMKHPYLNFYQAKAIFEHRQNKGDLHTIDELSRLEGFRATDIERLRPYIIFE